MATAHFKLGCVFYAQGNSGNALVGVHPTYNLRPNVGDRYQLTSSCKAKYRTALSIVEQYPESLADTARILYWMGEALISVGDRLEEQTAQFRAPELRKKSEIERYDEAKNGAEDYDSLVACFHR